jgi:pimeloyl-ACP methyl ester carboxylesterase
MMEKVYVNGTTLAYERHGRGTPLVLLHGYPLDHTIWRQLVSILEDRADLILPDLRGFGETDVTENAYSLADVAADVAALLDHLKIQQAVISGHSMGGYIALAFAKAFPQRVKGLGLVASQAVADPPDRRQARYDTAELVKLQGVIVVADSMPAKLTPDLALQRTLRQLILKQRPMGIITALAALAERPDSTPLLPNFHFPVAIIHGQEDALIPLERARQVQEMVPHGHLVEIEAVGHMPMMEAPYITADGLKTLL